MANREIKTTLKLEGEQQFRSAMKGAADSIKVLNSEQKLAQAQFEATGNKQQFLADKADILRRKIEEQQKAVKAAQEAVQKLKDKGVEPTNKSMQEWTRKLNDSQAYLTRLEGQLYNTEHGLDDQGKAFSDAAIEAENYSKQLENIGTGFNLENMISSLGALEQKLSSALSAVGRLAQGVYDAEVRASQWADDLLTQALMYNMDTETLQAWRYAAQFIDTDVETIISAQDRLMKNMTSESEDTQLMFNRFGVVTRNTDKSLRDVNATFWDTIDALGKVEDAHGKALTQAERDAAAQALFGKSYRELIPLINASSKGWEEAVQMGREVAVVDDKRVQTLGEFNDKYNDLMARWETLKNNVLAGLSEPLTQFAAATSEAVTKFNQFLESAEGQEALSQLSAALSELVGTVTDIGFSFAFAMATKAIEGLTEVLKWINDHGLAVAIALGSIASAVALIKVATPVLEMLKLLKAIDWLNMQKGADSLGKSLSSGAPEKAAEAAKGAATGGGLLNLIKGVFGNAIPAAIAAAYAGTVTAPVWGTQLAEQRDFGGYLADQSRVAETMQKTGDEHVARMQELYEQFTAMAEKNEALNKQNVQSIIAAREEIEKLTGKDYSKELDSATEYFKENGLDFMTEYDFESALSTILADLGEAIRAQGSDVAQGLADGMNENTAPQEAAGSMAENVENTVADALQTHSPSVVMHNIGLGVAQGLANGINAGAAAAISAAANLAAQVNAALSSVQAASIGSYGGSMGRVLGASPSYAGASLGGTISGSINNVINISGKQVAQSITPFVNRNMATALRASTR